MSEITNGKQGESAEQGKPEQPVAPVVAKVHEMAQAEADKVREAAEPVVEKAQAEAEKVRETAEPVVEKAQAEVERLKTLKPVSHRMVVVMNVLFTITVVLTGVLTTLYLLQFIAAFSTVDVPTRIYAFIFLGLLAANAIGGIALIVYDYNTHMERARRVARWTELSLVLSLLLSFITVGLQAMELVYVFQFGCLIFFQLYTDQELARNKHFSAPWDKNTAADRKDYIPLNFFHIFWIFVICCVIGLLIEVVFHAVVYGGYQDRAGVLWGPFSPIYGFGGVLMTVALNRFWNRSKLMIFLVAGLIGAAFEFLTSWFMETAFGIVAWDYSGTFLNIGGRTNFAFFCAWGLLGLMWIRLLLPDVLKLVDAIPIKLRAVLTVTFATFMLVDCVMTLVTLNCWYERQAGQEPTTMVQAYCANHYGDDYMANRFQTMNMDTSRTSRVA